MCTCIHIHHVHMLYVHSTTYYIQVCMFIKIILRYLNVMCTVYIHEASSSSHVVNDVNVAGSCTVPVM